MQHKGRMSKPGFNVRAKEGVRDEVKDEWMMGMIKKLPYSP
jgi:hypothetical protein